MAIELRYGTVSQVNITGEKAKIGMASTAEFKLNGQQTKYFTGTSRSYEEIVDAPFKNGDRIFVAGVNRGKCFYIYALSDNPNEEIHSNGHFVFPFLYNAPIVITPVILLWSMGFFPSIWHNATRNFVIYSGCMGEYLISMQLMSSLYVKKAVRCIKSARSNGRNISRFPF